MSSAVPVAAAPSIDLRFAQLIQQFGLTKNSFAVSLGKTASVVQHLIDGRNKPGFDLLCRVFEVYPNVSRDWLLLGQGTMLVGNSSSSSVRPAPAAETPAPELPLAPIDLSDVEPRPVRRASIGLAGSRLNPADIAATLALATAATAATEAEADSSAASSNEPDTPRASLYPDARGQAEQAENTPQAPPAPALAPGAPVTTAATPPQPAAAVWPAAASAPVDFAPAAAGQAYVSPQPAAVPVSPPAVALPGPEVYLTVALQAQQLQHQLALAELRNQHLLEQQQMLREMLAMARQAMV